ncbi:hypothetical protein BC829DRAFT_23663 [Chytridium lagenaria]|nr:hypothetical protein BC829DRAFT_23663 [Chytridium lagenaria]
MASSGGSDWDESERGGDSRGRRRTPSDSHSSVVSRDRMESDARFIPAPPSMRPPAPPSVTSSERSLNKTPTRQPRLPPSRSLASGEIPTRVISYADLNSASRDTVAQDREAGIGSSSQSLHSEPTDASSTSIAPRSLKRSDTKRLSSSGNMALKRLESRSSIASSQHSESRNKVRKSLAGSELRTSWDLSGDLNTSSEILKSSDTLDSRDDTGKKPSPLDRGLKSSKSVIMNNSEESLGRGAVENRSLTLSRYAVEE